MCKHENTEAGAPRPFFGPVSSDENPMAHGNICVEYRCVECGARQKVNINGGHEENGPWFHAENINE